MSATVAIAVACCGLAALIVCVVAARLGVLRISLGRPRNPGGHT